jgi:hypothetical protein
MPRISNIKVRRGNSSEWAAANPILDSGEPGYDKTSAVLKIGDATNRWGDLPSVILGPNPELAEGATQCNLICLRSKIVNFKSVSETQIFTVPPGCIFLVDKMEILTTSISSAGDPPSIRFGKHGSSGELHESSAAQTNSIGERHIIESPQNGVVAGSIVTFGVTEASTAASHFGCGIVTGYLFTIESESSSSSSSSNSAIYFKSNSTKNVDVSW